MLTCPLFLHRWQQQQNHWRQQQQNIDNNNNNNDVRATLSSSTQMLTCPLFLYRRQQNKVLTKTMTKYWQYQKLCHVRYFARTTANQPVPICQSQILSYKFCVFVFMHLGVCICVFPVQRQSVWTSPNPSNGDGVKHNFCVFVFMHLGVCICVFPVQR